MGATKFTAGPWQSIHDNDASGVCDIIGNIDGPDDGHWRYTRVCDLNEEPEDWLANRDLICAAPDLFNALTVLADRMQSLSAWLPVNEVDRAALARAREVLAKANRPARTALQGVEQ